MFTNSLTFLPNSSHADKRPPKSFIWTFSKGRGEFFVFYMELLWENTGLSYLSNSNSLADDHTRRHHDERLRKRSRFVFCKLLSYVIPRSGVILKTYDIIISLHESLQLMIMTSNQ